MTVTTTTATTAAIEPPQPDSAPGLPDLLYSPIEDELRDSVRRACAARSPWLEVLARTESAASTDTSLWRTLSAELGVTALAVPEELGGGASWRETAVVLEELGRAVAAVPFLGSAVLSTCLALELDARDLLASLATGETVAAVLAPATSPDPVARQAAVTVSGERVSGSVRSVADALTATVLLVPAADGSIRLVRTSDPGVSVTAVVSLDMTRQLADITLDDVASEVIGDGPDAAAAAATVAQVGAALFASEQLGLAEWCLDATVSYLKERKQFGRPLGSFQALKHRCADLWVRITEARAVARYAAACAAGNDADLAVAAATAQALCSDVAVEAAELCVQFHGGIGFTWEFPAHLYLKRAKASQLTLGSPDRHRRRLAELVALPPADEGASS